MRHVHSNNKLLIVLALIASLLSALGLSLESYMGLKGTSLCQTSACEIVGRFVRFGEPVLVTVGAVFFWLLTLHLFFTHRYPRKFRWSPLLLLLPALAFDGSLVGFQFFIINQRCILCILMALFLVGISFLYLFAVKARKVMLALPLFIWLAGFFANFLMLVPDTSNSVDNIDVYQRVAIVEKNQKPGNGDMTLVFSMECPHCFQVLATLATINPKDVDVRFTAIDLDKSSLRKIRTFVNEADKHSNPYSFLVKLKREPIEDSQSSDLSELKKKSQQTLLMLELMKISVIPVLIIESSSTKKNILVGSESINTYLKQRYPNKL